MADRLRSILRLALFVLAALFIVAPLLAVLLSSITPREFVRFPPGGLSLRWYSTVLSQEQYLDGFRVSLVVAICTSILSTVIGTMAAIVLVRRRFRLRGAVAMFLNLSIVFPVTLIGVTFLMLTTRVGIPQGTPALILGHVLLTIPFSVGLATVALTGFDDDLERAARNLGASPLRAFLHVTFPVLRSSLVAIAALVFLISFGEVSLAIFVVTPEQTTVPVAIFTAVQQSFSPAVSAMSGVVLIGAVVIVLLLERFAGVAGLLMGARARRERRGAI